MSARVSKSCRSSAKGMVWFPARYGSACLMMLVKPVGEVSRQTKFELPPVRGTMLAKGIPLETKYSSSSGVVVIAMLSAWFRVLNEEVQCIYMWERTRRY